MNPIEELVWMIVLAMVCILLFVMLIATAALVIAWIWQGIETLLRIVRGDSPNDSQ